MSERVLMAMSGGIDSTVAAMLLLEQGFELEAVTFKAFELNDNKKYCKNEAVVEAKQRADELGINHHVLDIQKEFSDIVIADFIGEYLHGRTPNPCVTCNTFIKWGFLLEMADKLNCHYIATGHYAQIGEQNGRYFIGKGADKKKDQSYFLWKLSQEKLSRTLFPLGGWTKEEVRRMASQKGYEALSQIGESQEICFIPNNDYRVFLSENVADYALKYPSGNFINTKGEIVGTHKGYPNYTIGQRKGLQVAFGVPKYVCGIDALKNEIMLGDRDDLLSNGLKLREVNFQKYDSIPDGFVGNIKIRYKNEGLPAKIFQKEDSLEACFSSPLSAVTPGQSAVIYEEDDIVGGGIIL